MEAAMASTSVETPNGAAAISRRNRSEPSDATTTTTSNSTSTTSTDKHGRTTPRKYRHVAAVHSKTRPSCLSHDSRTSPSFLGFRNLMVIVLGMQDPLHELISMLRCAVLCCSALRCAVLC